jgi:hypothetical protein
MQYYSKEVESNFFYKKKLMDILWDTYFAMHIPGYYSGKRNIKWVINWIYTKKWIILETEQWMVTLKFFNCYKDSYKEKIVTMFCELI